MKESPRLLRESGLLLGGKKRMSKTQIVVLGAGYAGLKTVKGLQKKT